MAKEKKIKPKTPKSRADKYNDKIKVNATFEQLAKELITPKPKK
jgi:hypothetical protein